MLGGRGPSVPTIVYRFGLRPPIEGDAHVREQMRLAHRYRNTLVEIERRRRAELRDIDRVSAPAEYEAARAALERLDAAVDGVKKARVAARSVAVADDPKRVLREARTVYFAAVRQFLAALRVDKSDRRREAIAAVKERSNEAVRAARGACGVYWGTYLLVEAAHEKACEVPLWDGVLPKDPPFVSAQDDVTVVGAQLHGGGMTPTELFSGESQWLRTTAPDRRAWESPLRSERRFFSRNAPGARRDAPAPLLFRMRIGSTGKGNREPVWATWPVILHRELHPAAVIKEAKVRLVNHGRRDEWTLCLTVNLPEGTTRGRCGTGSVALNLGWRMLDDGSLRVGTWADEVGEHGDLTLSPREVERFGRVAGLRSVRDQHFDAAREALLSHLAATPAEALPDWMTERTKTLGRWRSPGRLQALVRRWLAPMLRVKGDAPANDGSAAAPPVVGHAEVRDWRPPTDRPWELRDFARWAYRDWHLDEYEAGARDKMLGARREYYRVVAATLARRYGTLVVDDFDMREVAKRNDLTDDAHEVQAARTQRVIVAASLLRLTMVQAFVARGGVVQKVAAQDMTKTCADCGALEEFDAAKAITHTCSQCGSVWDQDVNNCRNALRRAREQRGAAETAGIARTEETPAKKPSRSERLAAAKKAKGTKKPPLDPTGTE